MDDRNYDITNKVYDVLNNVKGFDVAMSNPRAGKIIVKHKGLNFYMTIEPIFSDTDEEKRKEKKPFEEITKTHSFIFK
jgi:dihydrodipicolinate synthase/N-acetylneuraminate lyase